MTEDEVAAASEAIRSGWITMGYKTLEFENSFRDFLKAGNAVSMNSGTAALHLALKVLDLKQNDEVIMPAMTFAATAEVATYFGAKPVFADIDRNTHNISAGGIDALITKKTRAIIPVHYGGMPCDIESIMSLARERKIKVVEDAAHSLPAWYGNRMIGTIGDITCFSFYATKPLATGEGGMAVTENDAWADRMRKLRLHGISRDAWKRYTLEGTWVYDVDEPGYKYNMTDINAAIGIEQLKKVMLMRDMRRAIAEKYTSAFSNCDQLIPYAEGPGVRSSWHLYPLKLNIESLKISRDEFILLMKERQIGTSVHFIPLYRFSYYKNFCPGPENFANCEWVFERCVSLPIYPAMAENEVDYVTDNVLDIVKRNKR